MDLSKKLFSTKEKEVLSPADLATPEKLINSSESTHLDQELNQPAQESPNTTTQKNLENDVSQQHSANVATTKLSQTVAFKKIEEILENDLEELYFKMDETHQRIFKEEGEKTAYKIEQVVAAGKSITFKIVALIKSWLNLIPGVNKFFIDQESKIKADQIIKVLKH